MEIRCPQISALVDYLLALCALATLEAVLGECVAILGVEYLAERRKIQENTYSRPEILNS